MARKKLQKFQQLETLANVLELNNPNLAKGIKKFIKNAKKLHLELGCGKAEYTLNLAQKLPKDKFIALDLNGARLFDGAKKALNLKLNNILFLRIDAKDLEKYLTKNSVDSIWLTFPDPQIKKRNTKKRFSSPLFLNSYKKYLKKNNTVKLKTDSKMFYQYTKEVLKEKKIKILHKSEDLYQNKNLTEELKIITTFEKKKIAGDKIYYLKFRL